MQLQNPHAKTKGEGERSGLLECWKIWFGLAGGNEKAFVGSWSSHFVGLHSLKVICNGLNCLNIQDKKVLK